MKETTRKLFTPEEMVELKKKTPMAWSEVHQLDNGDFELNLYQATFTDFYVIVFHLVDNKEIELLLPKKIKEDFLNLSEEELEGIFFEIQIGLERFLQKE